MVHARGGRVSARRIDLADVDTGKRLLTTARPVRGAVRVEFGHHYGLTLSMAQAVELARALRSVVAEIEGGTLD